MTPTPGEDPAADDAPEPVDPAAIISPTNELPTRPPGAWHPPPPLSLGPLEPPPGPLVSPSLAAYRPSAVPWPSEEPSTTSINVPISAAPVTSYPSATAPAAPAAAVAPVEDPVSPDPASALPVPPAPASYFPPPFPQYPPPARYPAATVYAAPAAYPPGMPAYPPSAPPAALSYPPAVGYLPGYSAPAAYPPVPPPYPSYAPGVFSDRSKQTAGLLQLLLGLLGIGGVGRLYAGNTELGIVQVILSGVGWICLVCGFFFAPLWLVYFGLWAWFVIDGVLILAGDPVDGKGRPLR